MIVEVLVDGSPHAVAPTAGDLVRLEREYGISASSLSDETVSVEHVLYLAFVGLRRTKAIESDLSFDDFLDLADVGERQQLDPPPPRPLS